MNAESVLTELITALVATGILAWLIRLFWKSARGPALVAGAGVAASQLAIGRPIAAVAAVLVALALWQSFARKDAKPTRSASRAAR
jgi:hypothetical protein